MMVSGHREHLEIEVEYEVRYGLTAGQPLQEISVLETKRAQRLLNIVS